MSLFGNWGKAEVPPSSAKEQKERAEHKQESTENPPGAFFERIGRPELKEVITKQKPWVYWTMEIYRPETAEKPADIKGQGGLGILAGDTLETMKKENIPAIFITPFYPIETAQVVENFEQKIEYKKITPEVRGFKKTGEADIFTFYKEKIVPTKLDVPKKEEGSVTILTPTEPNFGELYQDKNNSDHRLYQEIALCFAGYKALEQTGVEPAVQQLNEAPTLFAAFAALDRKVQETRDFQKSLEEIRKKFLYTNHTLVPAVEAQFTLEQFERMVLPNIQSEEVKNWIRSMFHGKGDSLRSSTFAFELAGKKNGVSMIHALEAGSVYKDYRGRPIRFEAVTNGISLERWADPQLLAYYKKEGVLDSFGLPADNFEEKIDALDPKVLKKVKQAGRKRLREVLKTRKDQYGNAVEIPAKAKVVDWARRFAAYKRPEMMFLLPHKLAEILKTRNYHMVISGKAHFSDTQMQSHLAEILSVIDKNPILKARIHYIQDYDEPLARALSHGSDVSLNTPTIHDESGRRISTEACGTSIFKKVVGNTILISVEDGGMADPRLRADQAGTGDNFEAPYLEITGDTYEQELGSLYNRLQKAANILEDPVKKVEFWKKQLKGFLPVISDGRMERDYINLAFPASKE